MPGPCPLDFIPIEFILGAIRKVCPKTWRRQWHPTPVLLPGKSHGSKSPVGVAKSRTWLSDFTFTFYFHALKEMATHSSVLAWRIPGTGEPGGLPSMGSNRVGHDWSDLAAAAALKLQDLPNKYHNSSFPTMLPKEHVWLFLFILLIFLWPHL